MHRESFSRETSTHLPRSGGSLEDTAFSSQVMV